MAKGFSDTVRYIDDLLTLNNSTFEEEMPNTYPPELTLKRTSESDTNLSYLLVYVVVNVTEVYDKRDAFNFNIHVVNFLYMSSNIPANPTCGIYVKARL